MKRKEMGNVVNVYGGHCDYEFDEEVLRELDDLTEEELEDDFHGEVLDEEKWALYEHIRDILQILVQIDPKIEEVQFQKTPCPTSSSATVMLKFPCLWGTFDRDVKDAIGRAVMLADGVVLSSLDDEKLRLTLSVTDIWKS